jgi:hypothetical protein
MALDDREGIIARHLEEQFSSFHFNPGEEGGVVYENVCEKSDCSDGEEYQPVILRKKGDKILSRLYLKPLKLKKNA